MNVVGRIIKYLSIAFAVYLIFNIFYGLSYVVNIGNNVFSNEDFNINKKLEEIDINKDIKNISTNIRISNVNIIKSDEFKIETNNDNIKFMNDKNSLYIEEKRNNWFKDKDNYELNIYVKEDQVFDNININNGVGKFNIEYLNSKNINIDLGIGDINIDYLNIENKTIINGGVGKLSINNGNLSNLKLDNGIGNTTIKGKINGKNEIDLGIGKLDLLLIDNIDNYNINIDEGLGNIKINGEKISSNKFYGNGNNLIDIDGGIGSINIEYFG